VTLNLSPTPPQLGGAKKHHSYYPLLSSDKGDEAKTLERKYEFRILKE
jgi:hypothetical protein